ncbi:protocadherin Fat 4-like [Physella acuta]|uniref:protocadherin Fat 4-like n=1 Tax=Physella acuta TaxID=109671 RepID=UPI0027DCFC68|nr:protocadherin Fat 4-like [Physella acuta]
MANMSHLLASCLLMLTYMKMVACQVPIITPFTRPYNIHEDTIIETSIVEVKCTNPGDACLCNVKEINPVNGPFTVWKKTSTSAFYCYYTGQAQGGKLSFKTNPTYFITIECRNELDTNSSTTLLEIDVQQNQAPVISNSNYPRETLTLDVGRPYVPGDVIYTVSATDAENDPLTYSISTSPSVDYFTIGSRDGIMAINTDLRAATEKYIVITVTVKDKVNTVNDFEIFVTLTNMNSRPLITNLPATMTVLETAASGYNIMTLTFSDSDIYVPQLVPTCTVVPNGDQYKFTYESGTQKLRLSTLANAANPLDYETTSQYKITCVLSDGFLDSQNDVLTLNVQNVNEAPTFDEIAYYCDLYESNAGVSLCDLDAVIVDPEGDTITSIGFVSGNNSNRFRYDRSTTTITFNVDYDVDQNAMPTSVVLQLQAVDVYGASKTVPVYINIMDSNDNTCSFGATSSVTFKADQSTQLGSLGSFAATDNDRTSPNNLLSYEVIQAIPSDSLNYISAYSDGSLAYIGLIPESNTGKSYSLVVRCKDGGSPQRTSQGTIVLTYQITTTTSTTTTTTTSTTSTSTTTSTTTASSNIFNNDAFVAVFAILMSLLVLGLLVGLYFLLRMCGLCGAPSLGAAGGAPSGNLCGQNGCNDFCCPKQEVQPVDDYFNTAVRTNNDYRDPYWKTSDHYETGTGYNSAGDPYAKNALEGGFKRLALPAPPPQGHQF